MLALFFITYTFPLTLCYHLLFMWLSILSRSSPICTGNNGRQPPETNSACKQRVQLDREGASAFLFSSLHQIHVHVNVSLLAQSFPCYFVLTHVCSNETVFWCRWMTTFAAVLSTNLTDQNRNPVWWLKRALRLRNPWPFNPESLIQPSDWRRIIP